MKTDSSVTSVNGEDFADLAEKGREIVAACLAIQEKHRLDSGAKCDEETDALVKSETMSLFLQIMLRSAALELGTARLMLLPGAATACGMVLGEAYELGSVKMRAAVVDVMQLMAESNQRGVNAGRELSRVNGS